MSLLASIGNWLMKVGGVLEMPTSVAPGTPDAGQARLWVDSTTKALSSLDELGRQWVMMPPLAHAEMYRYDNVLGVDIYTADVYHPIANAGVAPGDLLDWTFVAGQVGTILSIADLGMVGGSNQVRIETGAAHTLLAGQVIGLTSVATYGATYLAQAATADHEDNYYIIKNVSDSTHFDIVSAFPGTATGTWSKGATLVAGADAAGIYLLSWSANILGAGNNKTFRLEPRLNVVEIDKAAAIEKPPVNIPTCLGRQCLLMVAANDRLSMSCKNQDDTSNFTLTHSNCLLWRIGR